MYVICFCIIILECIPVYKNVNYNTASSRSFSRAIIIGDNSSSPIISPRGFPVGQDVEVKDIDTGGLDPA